MVSPPVPEAQASAPPDAAQPPRPAYRRSAAYAVLTFGSTAALALVTTITTARLYGAEVVGEFALVSAPFLALVLLSSLREQAALVRKLASLPPRDPRVSGY